MTKKNKRDLVVHLVEKGEIFNNRIIAEHIAKQIKNGGIQL